MLIVSIIGTMEVELINPLKKIKQFNQIHRLFGFAWICPIFNEIMIVKERMFVINLSQVCVESQESTFWIWSMHFSQEII